MRKLTTMKKVSTVNKTIKNLLFTVPVVAIASVMSVPAMADGHGDGEGKYACHSDKHGSKWGKKGKHGKHGMQMSERMQKKLTKKLDLTDAQSESLATIFVNNSVDMQGLREASCVMFEKLATLEPGSDAYNAQIDEITTTQAANLAAGMKAWGQAQVEIAAILNEEQKAEFEEMLAHMQKHRH